jgi:hypothetical protein
VFFLISSPLFLICIIGQNRQKFKVHKKSRPLLKIEISSNGQNCSILTQKVPKFELHKHKDELFNIITGFFMNFELLPILTDYANLKKGG